MYTCCVDKEKFGRCYEINWRQNLQVTGQYDVFCQKWTSSQTILIIWFLKRETAKTWSKDSSRIVTDWDWKVCVIGPCRWQSLFNKQFNNCDFYDVLSTVGTCTLILGRRFGFLDGEVSETATRLADSVTSQFQASQEAFYGLPLWKLIPTKAYKEFVASEDALYEQVKFVEN